MSFCPHDGCVLAASPRSDEEVFPSEDEATEPKMAGKAAGPAPVPSRHASRATGRPKRLRIDLDAPPPGGSPKPVERAAPPHANAPPGRRRWGLMAMAVFCLLSAAGLSLWLTGLVELQMFDGRPISTPPVSLPDDGGSGQLDLLRYTVVPEPIRETDRAWFVEGSSRASKAFSLRVTPGTSGYLYIVAPAGERETLATFLTSRPGPTSGVPSNRLVPGSDFVFPRPRTALGVDEGSTTFSVVFSKDPLTSPGFLADRAERYLSAEEQRAWAAFEGRTTRAETRPLPGSDSQAIEVAVAVPRGAAAEGVFRFEITVTAP